MSRPATPRAQRPSLTRTTCRVEDNSCLRVSPILEQQQQEAAEAEEEEEEGEGEDKEAVGENVAAGGMQKVQDTEASQEMRKAELQQQDTTQVVDSFLARLRASLLEKVGAADTQGASSMTSLASLPVDLVTQLSSQLGLSPRADQGAN